MEKKAHRAKIFGERNTGTNALKQLIELNSESVCLPGVANEVRPFLGILPSTRLGSGRRGELLKDIIFATRSPLKAWKHCATNFASIDAFRGTLVLFTVRHPGSWVHALHRRPYGHVGPVSTDLRSFITTPWKTASRERLGRRRLYPLELYMKKFELMTDFAARLSQAEIPNLIIRQEDLVLAQQDVYGRVARHLVGCRQDPQQLTANAKKGSKTLAELKAYYSSEAWRAPLRGIETEIDRQIDWSLLDSVGYAPLLARTPVTPPVELQGFASDQALSAGRA